MIKRSTLRAQLAAALRDEILAGRLPPGSHFTVKEIAEQYGVSATPVREAMVDLAAQGLLDVEQHRGFRVHEFSADDYRAMVEARMLVMDGLFQNFVAGEPGGAGEAAAAVTAAAPVTAAEEGREEDGDPDAEEEPLRKPRVLSLDPAAIASVRRRAVAAERAARAGEVDVLIGYDLRYWRELAAAVGNPYICEFLDRLRVQCWVYAVPVLRGERGAVAKRLWAGHRELVDAVERRDSAAARRLVGDYHRHSLTLVGQQSVRLLP